MEEKETPTITVHGGTVHFIKADKVEYNNCSFYGGASMEETSGGEASGGEASRGECGGGQAGGAAADIVKEVMTYCPARAADVAAVLDRAAGFSESYLFSKYIVREFSQGFHVPPHVLVSKGFLEDMISLSGNAAGPGWSLSNVRRHINNIIESSRRAEKRRTS